MELILDTAKGDDRVRAVVLNGSRVNPTLSTDVFQDYDVVYFVEDLASFLADPGWVDVFGERMIMQLPDTMDDPPPASYDSFAYLMQFMDGNRIDLTLVPVDRLDERDADSLSLMLLDKDSLLGSLPPASEQDYLPAPPSEKAYADCCNEFWWVCPYVAKGLWRHQVLYAKATFEIIREQLMKMLTWYAGVETEFGVNFGSFGKRLDAYLEPEMQRMLMATYAGADVKETWDALFTMCELFRTTASAVGDHFGYAYPADDDRRVTNHLQHVRMLPRDAKRMY